MLSTELGPNGGYLTDAELDDASPAGARFHASRLTGITHGLQMRRTYSTFSKTAVNTTCNPVWLLLAAGAE